MKIEALFNVRGKTALITGGSRGLGEMIARAYVENGVTVYISSRKADACANVAQDLSSLGECAGLPADLSTLGEILRLAVLLEPKAFASPQGGRAAR
jgi:NAD(P)-dependent dehydrogenase (short-subunit alcohol dehydrogenase family)